jgi:hypothetical protein
MIVVKCKTLELHTRYFVQVLRVRDGKETLIYQQHVPPHRVNSVYMAIGEALSRVGSEFLLDLPEPPDAAADG